MDVALAYRAYAKLNLYLDVLKKRRDGYHNIETIFQSINLADQLTFSECRSRVSMT
ncbi:MAG TPA: 4-(cytidine 5'-diphospho)-2-C-methyl-D-erythritol kinase, partial [Candidatus Hydrogenedentes bacterium]|nr:4-(cytidine 5'-diphospho)-2-C-methyl-D-erythritol kinase [Candidatus Hydrogenedentota bacterium]